MKPRKEPILAYRLHDKVITDVTLDSFCIGHMTDSSRAKRDSKLSSFDLSLLLSYYSKKGRRFCKSMHYGGHYGGDSTLCVRTS